MRPRFSELVCVYLGIMSSAVHGLSWQLSSPSSECVSTYPKGNTTSSQDVALSWNIDYAFFSVTQGKALESSCPVYTWLLDPLEHIVHTERPRAHDEASFRLRAHQPGPWQLCFKHRVDKGDTGGSSKITLSYFTVTKASDADEQAYDSPVQEAVTVQSLPTQDYIQSLTDTVAVIDESLQAIERQQRHFIHRTEQHVEVLSKSQRSIVWWKSLHVLAVVGAVLIHRVLLTNAQTPESSASDAVLV